MAVITPPSYMQNLATHTAQTDRLAESGLLLPSGVGNTWKAGVRGFGDLLVAPQGSPNMTVQVAAGQCFILNSTALNGTYHVVNDASMNVTITAAHPSLPRIDLIICRVDDAFFSGVTNAASIIVATGTAAASPVAPTVTGSYIVLATVAVAAAATSIIGANITDNRVFASGLGGQLYVATTAIRNALTALIPGQTVWNAQTAAIEYWNGAAWNTIVPIPVYQNYTPTFTATAGTPAVGNGTLSGQFLQIGKKVDFNMRLLVGSTTTYGTAGAGLIFSLPVTDVANLRTLINGLVRTTVSFAILGELGGGGTVICRLTPATPTTSIASFAGNSIALAAGNTIDFQGSYQAA